MPLMTLASLARLRVEAEGFAIVQADDLEWERE